MAASSPLRYVLGIEGTAWSLSAAVVSEAEVVAEVSRPYVPPRGGIHPREAAQHHAEHIGGVLRECVGEAERRGVARGDIGAVAFSRGPGMGPCLRTVATAARALSVSWGVPLVGVNHAVAHMEVGRWRCGVSNPIVLYVSGGNTQVVAHREGRYRVMGETLDIGIGNGLDKFARGLGLGHPGGPRVEELARQASRYHPLPYSVKGMDLAFSGLVTAAEEMAQRGVPREEVCYSLQETAYAMLVEVAERAMAHAGRQDLLLAGGVAANLRLQEMCRVMCMERGARFHVPERRYLGDAGAMIAHTGLVMARHGFTLPVEESGVLPQQRADQVEAPWVGPAEEMPSLRGAEAEVLLRDGAAASASPSPTPLPRTGVAAPTSSSPTPLLRTGVAVKRRLPKSYRHPEVDLPLRGERVRREARWLAEARRAGVDTPILRGLDLEEAEVEMEALEGPSLRHGLTPEESCRAGALLGGLHGASILHGDYTPGNLMRHRGRVVVIDFGLSTGGVGVEERGVDVRIFLESLRALWPDRPHLREGFLEGYTQGFPGAPEVLQRVDEIEKRRRYSTQF
ncbi:MAG: bifunctional N(6)-L-threonylcarbamoyladenine synthase/serine/threonine protein kinase [Euryarchaeota archaeon]|nr:bifunctional N(6)-L-threonylcarbamoyladenine synthase/serine/threonine protein kinase [Euryarchaeota archaeon]